MPIFPPTKVLAVSDKNLPVSVVVVVFPSLPVTAKVLALVYFKKLSISDVSIAPFESADNISGISGRIPGERKIISAVKFSKPL